MLNIYAYPPYGGIFNEVEWSLIKYSMIIYGYPYGGIFNEVEFNEVE